MGFRAGGSEILFTCQQREIVFVHTAMIEVVAAVEQTIRELRRPLDAREIQRGLQEASAEGTVESPAQASLRGYVRPETLCPRLRSNKRESVIEELLDAICAAGGVLDRAAALRAVLARERNLSTGLQHGVALPHAQTEAVSSLVCAVGLKPEGVDFASMDGQPARIVVLTLSPRNANAPYLQFISTVSKVLSAQGRAALLACDSAEDMYAILTGVGDRPRRHAFWHRPEVGAGPLASLNSDRVVIDLAADSWDAVIDTLLALCAREGAVLSPEVARRALMEREAAMTTAIGKGLALPHARTDAVDSIISALGILRTGVDFGALDGEPVKIVVLTLLPPSVTSEYTDLVSAILRAVDGPGREAILTANSPEAVVEALQRS